MHTTGSEAPPPDGSRRAWLHQVIFEADTYAGKAFDVGLIALIVISVVAVSVESMRGLSARTTSALVIVEWVLTAVFTLEYVLRLVAVKRPLTYATSFFGVVDLMAILPTWVGLLVPGAQALLVIRVLRLLRIFRILKLARFLSEAQTLTRALRASSRKIAVFLLSVATIVVIVGAVMFVVEGPANGFTSIPVSMYWAIVTLTTVGYGDIAPQTPLGQTLASFVMVLGYGIIAVPTGIVTTELALGNLQHGVSTQACPSCSVAGHDFDAKFCRICGAHL